MAESVLFSVAESLIGKLASLAVEEASLAYAVYDDLDQMKQTLSLIKAVLLDAELKQHQNNELREWLRQIKHVLNDAENVVVDVECEALRKHVINIYGGFSRKVRHFFSTSNPLVYRLRMAHELKDIIKKLDKVASDRQKFGLQINDVDTRVVHRRELTDSHVTDSEVIGRDDDKEKTLKLLLKDESEDESLSIVPIVGIGGLGKTTLAKLIFNDEIIDNSFSLKIWVCVSEDFELRNLLVKILSSALNSTQEMYKNLEMQQLKNHLRNTLAGQKFLLVLDDVWNEDRVKWIELKNLIQVNGNGSKVLVTTRSHSIASMMGTESPYVLQGLSRDDSLSLFVKWAFKEGEEKRYPQLVEIAKEIVGKCVGLPLAIRTLGSSLFLKINIEDWEFIRDNDIWNLPQKDDDILPALKLSYDQIPSYLKQCFACFSLFRKDFDFVTGDILVLWEALGFLSSPKKGQTLDDVGNQFLRELQSRSLLQDFVDLGTACGFKLHDLVHDLSVYVAKDEFQILTSPNQSISNDVRHLSSIDNEFLGQAPIPKSLKSIYFPMGANNEGFLNSLLSRCKYLRLLNLEGSEYESLPHSIGKLKHLRFLSLSNNENLRKLPGSICNLQNLQGLSVNGCIKLEKLPKGIGNLINLRQLHITTKQSNFPKEIANLTSLEILSVYDCYNMQSLLEGIQLPSLSSLSIVNCGSLKTLPLHVIPNLENFNIFNCHNLELSKSLDNKIFKLRLKSICLRSLPQLVTLPQWLQGSVNTLRSLVIQDCCNFEELPGWLSALVCLKTLSIENTPMLVSLPDDMCCLTNLEYLHISDCPDLCERCKPEVGPDWPKISHIKRVFIEEVAEE
ncbi:hypothetical protein RJT34_23911 [Clitoria ternatea]|uniref:Uncharacterized protein n=1 Tax=Clitoria ternatea TaxID=43366 RepID=A0AAN9IH01_CLITE